MTISVSLALANAMLAGSPVATKLSGGFIYIFAGTVPATADTALDMVGTHTLLAKIAADAIPVDAGVTGLTFEATAVNRAIVKKVSEAWAAKINFVGKDAASAGVSPLTATFYRHCETADNGQAAGSTGATSRIQGTVGTAGTDLVLTSVSLSDNGTNTVGIGAYEVRVAV